MSVNLETVEAQNDWHYENGPIQIYRKFHLQKLKNVQFPFKQILDLKAPENMLWVHIRTCDQYYKISHYERTAAKAFTHHVNPYPAEPRYVLPLQTM